MTPAPWELRAGDCLDPVGGLASLPTGAIDVVLTDPPYSEHVHTCQRKGGTDYAGDQHRASFCRTRELGFAHLEVDVMRACAAHFARVARRWVAAFSDTESAHLWRESLEDAGLDYVRTLFWRKLNGAPQFTGDRPAVALEAITLCHPKGRKKWNGGGKAGFYECPIVLNRGGQNPRLHTTQKPIELMRALVADFSNPGELIVDPFAGSGTTGIAAVGLGRRFLGWEVDVDRYEIARRRLAGEEVRPPEGQIPLFAGGRP